MRTAYSAGRYRQQLRLAALRPIWIYQSPLVGKNRRADHLALHDKAFRYDDPFWDANYPRNGWNCECEVITLSESGAEREGIEIMESDADGNPPAMVDRNGNAVDWDKFAPETWRYKAGRESLAPDFDKYTNLPEELRTEMKANYHREMSNTSMTEGEFVAFMGRYNEKDYHPINVIFQVGNLEFDRFKKMQNEGVTDSKIMAFDHDLHHGTADKYKDQTVPTYHYKTVYKAINNPDHIYFEKGTDNDKQGKAFHFVKSTGDGKVIKVFLRHSGRARAMKITTIGWIPDEYQNHPTRYKEIW
jgi:hypothetical protein